MVYCYVWVFVLLFDFGFGVLGFGVLFAFVNADLWVLRFVILFGGVLCGLLLLTAGCSVAGVRVFWDYPLFCELSLMFYFGRAYWLC